MNVLDENILESQRQLLRSWRIPVRQIGAELGRKGMADEEILPFLLTLSRPTFFTRDLGFARWDFCHEKRCLVVLAVGQYEAAHFIRRTLQHAAFNTQAKRMGAVIRVTATGLIVWTGIGSPVDSRERIPFDEPCQHNIMFTIVIEVPPGAECNIAQRWQIRYGRG